MQIKLDNIGIVKDSTIKLDGLTVITGKNNSGKTTVGKTLYSMLDAVCDLPRKAARDRSHYIYLNLGRVEIEWDAFRRVFSPSNENMMSEKYKLLGKLVSRRYRREVQRDEMERFAQDLLQELCRMDVATAIGDAQVSRLLNYVYLLKNETRMQQVLENARERSIAILEKLFVDIEKDSQLIDYVRTSVDQTLWVEFSGQIQPVKSPNVVSQVELSDDRTDMFKFSMKNNHIVNDVKSIFVSSPFRNVYLIDDPYVLDGISQLRILRTYDETEVDVDGILDITKIYSHSVKLTDALRSGKQLSVLEENVLKDSLSSIKQKIDSVIPGTFEFASDGEYYVQNGAKLKIENLAAGSKMFSIIKILLEYGKIDDTTMLILDEPEAHLHPMWQNAFAEVIVLLVKELNTHVLLTTHSANFMLAIDAYMRKYEIADQTNFYQTEELENGFVRYHCVNDDMGKIYEDFLQYLSEVKVLRNHYLNGLEE